MRLGPVYRGISANVSPTGAWHPRDDGRTRGVHACLAPGCANARRQASDVATRFDLATRVPDSGFRCYNCVCMGENSCALQKQWVAFASGDAPRYKFGSYPHQGVYHSRSGSRPSVAFLATHHVVDFTDHYMAKPLAE